MLSVAHRELRFKTLESFSFLLSAVQGRVELDGLEGRSCRHRLTFNRVESEVMYLGRDFPL